MSLLTRLRELSESSNANRQKQDPKWSAVAGGIRGGIAGGVAGAYVGVAHPKSIHAYVSKIGSEVAHPISESFKSKMDSLREEARRANEDDADAWKHSSAPKSSEPYSTGEFTEAEKLARHEKQTAHRAIKASQASKHSASKAIKLTKQRIGKSALIGAGVMGGAHALYGYARAKSNYQGKDFSIILPRLRELSARSSRLRELDSRPRNANGQYEPNIESGLTPDAMHAAYGAADSPRNAATIDQRVGGEESQLSRKIRAFRQRGIKAPAGEEAPGGGIGSGGTTL